MYEREREREWESERVALGRGHQDARERERETSPIDAAPRERAAGFRGIQRACAALLPRARDYLSLYLNLPLCVLVCSFGSLFV